MGDHHAVDVALLEELRDALGELHQLRVGEAFGRDLEHLLTADIGDLAELRHRGDQFVDRDLGGLVGRAVADVGAGTRDRAASRQHDHVGLACRRLGRGLGKIPGQRDRPRAGERQGDTESECGGDAAFAQICSRPGLKHRLSPQLSAQVKLRRRLRRFGRFLKNTLDGKRRS